MTDPAPSSQRPIIGAPLMSKKEFWTWWLISAIAVVVVAFVALHLYLRHEGIKIVWHIPIIF